MKSTYCTEAGLGIRGHTGRGEGHTEAGVRGNTEAGMGSRGHTEAGLGRRGHTGRGDGGIQSQG